MNLRDLATSIKSGETPFIVTVENNRGEPMERYVPPPLSLNHPVPLLVRTDESLDIVYGMTHSLIITRDFTTNLYNRSGSIRLNIRLTMFPNNYEYSPVINDDQFACYQMSLKISSEDKCSLFRLPMFFTKRGEAEEWAGELTRIQRICHDDCIYGYRSNGGEALLYACYSFGKDGDIFTENPVFI